jgi:hypothetical protein
MCCFTTAAPISVTTTVKAPKLSPTLLSRLADHCQNPPLEKLYGGVRGRPSKAVEMHTKSDKAISARVA